VSRINALRQAWRYRWRWRYAPKAILENWEASGWNEDGYKATKGTEFAASLLDYGARVRAAWRCLTCWSVPKSWTRPELACNPIHEQVFYRIKAAVCFVLCLRSSTDSYRRDDIEVVYYDQRSYETMDGPGGEWTEARVGLGVFRNWYAAATTDSSP
jgi:hypothetical protein